MSTWLGPRMDAWACGACTFHNTSTSTVCGCCGTGAPPPVVPPPIAVQLSAQLAEMMNVPIAVARAALDDPANLKNDGARDFHKAGRAIIAPAAPPPMARQLSADLAEMCQVPREAARSALDAPENMRGGERDVHLAGRALFMMSLDAIPVAAPHTIAIPVAAPESGGGGPLVVGIAAHPVPPPALGRTQTQTLAAMFGIEEAAARLALRENSIDGVRSLDAAGKALHMRALGALDSTFVWRWREARPAALARDATTKSAAASAAKSATTSAATSEAPPAPPRGGLFGAVGSLFGRSAKTARGGPATKGDAAASGDADVGVVAATATATAMELGPWQVFKPTHAAQLSEALLAGKAHVELDFGRSGGNGTALLRQMVLHRHTDGALFELELKGQPDPAITPASWVPQFEDDEAKLFNVPKESDEFKWAEAVLQLRLPKSKLVAAQRVQDIDLWQRYRVQLDWRARENDGDPNERWLFHGTGSTDPVKIWREGDVGFDARMSGAGYFGKNAAYFSESAYYRFVRKLRRVLPVGGAL